MLQDRASDTVTPRNLNCLTLNLLVRDGERSMESLA